MCFSTEYYNDRMRFGFFYCAKQFGQAKITFPHENFSSSATAIPVIIKDTKTIYFHGRSSNLIIREKYAKNELIAFSPGILRNIQ